MTRPLQTISFTNSREREAFYGVTGAALRGWRKKGEQAGDPFPEDSPHAVVEWYRRHYAKSVPQPLLLAAAKFGAAAAKKKKGKPGDPEAMDPGGLAESLERARKIEAYYGNLLEEALRTKQKADAELYRDPWLKAQAAVKDLEKAAVSIAKARKELIERNAVVASWTNLHSHLPRIIEREMIAARPEPVAADDWTRAVRSAMDAAFGRLPDVLPEILAGGPAAEKILPELSSCNPGVLAGGSAAVPANAAAPRDEE